MTAIKLLQFDNVCHWHCEGCNIDSLEWRMVNNDIDQDAFYYKSLEEKLLINAFQDHHVEHGNYLNSRPSNNEEIESFPYRITLKELIK